MSIATKAPPKPLPPESESDLAETRAYRIKSRLRGRPLHNDQLPHERLGKPTALAVFASDNLSSSAYATEELLRVLVPAMGIAAIDLAAKKVRRDGEEVRLTPTERHLVEVLVRNRGRLVAQRKLLQEVWGPQYHDETNYLRVFMAQVRRKLEPEPAHPRYFITEPGMGYRFEVADG